MKKILSVYVIIIMVLISKSVYAGISEDIYANILKRRQTLGSIQTNPLGQQLTLEETLRVLGIGRLDLLTTSVAILHEDNMSKRAIYRDAKNNFQMLSIKVNDRLNRIFDESNVEEQGTNWIDISFNNGKGNNLLQSFEIENYNFKYGKDITFDEIGIGAIVSFNESKITTDYKKINVSYISGAIYSRYNFTDMFFINSTIYYSFNKNKESNNKVQQIRYDYNSNQISTNIATGIDTKYFVTKIGLNYIMLIVNSHKDNYDTIPKNTYNSLDGVFGIVFRNFMNDINGITRWRSIKINPQLFMEIGTGIIRPDIVANNKLNNTENDKSSIKKTNENSIQYGLNLDINIKKTLDINLSYHKTSEKNYTDGRLGCELNFSFY
jgi:hypothetical protein